MIRTLFIFLFPVILNAQTVILNPNLKTKVFCIATAEYIRLIQENDKRTLDTLYFGPEEYHKNKKLPALIGNTVIILLKDGKERNKILNTHPKINFVNIIENEANGKEAHFMFITFISEKLNGKVDWWPIHNCYVDLVYNEKTESFKYDKHKFEYSYSNKYTKAK